MARVFITGSSDGLGRMAAELLIEQGHRVVLHARNERRGEEALAAVPGAETVVIGDLSSIAQTRGVAEQVNRLGPFDGIIHNAGIGYQEPRRIATEDGLPHVFAVNTLAPYILTALLQRPKRLVYLSSGLHRSGDATLKDLAWEHRPWQGQQAYSDTKLHDVLLAFAVARRWPDVRSAEWICPQVNVFRGVAQTQAYFAFVCGSSSGTRVGNCIRMAVECGRLRPWRRRRDVRPTTVIALASARCDFPQ